MNNDPKTLLDQVLHALEKGEDLDEVISHLDPSAKSNLLELVELEKSLAALEPADEPLSPELVLKLRAALKMEPNSARQDTFSPGNSFGAYHIVRELGRGGMGTVYEAVQVHLGKRVAVKVIAPHILSDPQAVARFRREMKAAGKVEHGNVVRAMDAGEIQGTLYLVTEFVSGVDLTKLVAQNGPFPCQQALQIIFQASCALQAAHASGITHRDVKPSNLILTSSGQVKLLDLGLARVASDRQAEVTATGAIFGTPDYMAPEQWDDPKAVDGRTDLYALGCTLYFLLTGKPPYSGSKYPTTFSKMRAHMEEPCPDIPATEGMERTQVQAILAKLLAKKPEQRFASATELITSISQLIGTHDSDHNLASQQNELSDVELSGDSAHQATTVINTANIGRHAGSDDTSNPSTTRNRATLLTVFSLLTVLFVGGISYSYWNRNTGLEKSKSSSSNENEPIDRPIAQYELNRAAAEWIISVGGRFQLVDGTWISKLEDIPTSEFSMNEVYLVGCKGVDEEGYAKLSKIDRLERLACWDSPTDDACLSLILSSKPIQATLQSVMATRCQITDSVGRHFSRCQKLVSLNLTSTGITDLSFVNEIPALESLTIDDCELSVESKRLLIKNGSLKFINIDADHFEEIVRDRAVPFDNLKALGLFFRNANAPNRTWANKAISGCPNLSHLQLHFVGDSTIELELRALAEQKRLEVLHLHRTEIVDLAKNPFPMLKTVQLSGTEISIPTIQSYLTCSTSLNNMVLENCTFNKDILEAHNSISDVAIDFTITSWNPNDIAAAEHLARLLPFSKLTFNGKAIEPKWTKDDYYNPRSTAQLHRAVARRVIECGGMVSVIANNSTLYANDLSLLPSKDFAIGSIILQAARDWTVDDHSLLQRIQYIESLNYLPDDDAVTMGSSKLTVASGQIAIRESFAQQLNPTDAGVILLAIVRNSKPQSPSEDLLRLPSLRSLSAHVDANILGSVPESSLLHHTELTIANLSVESIRSLSRLPYLSEVIVKGDLELELIRQLAELPNLRLLCVGNSQGVIQSLASELRNTHPKLTLVTPNLESTVEEQQAIDILVKAGIQSNHQSLGQSQSANMSHYISDLVFQASQEDVAIECLPKIRHLQGIAINVSRAETLGAVVAHDELKSLRLTTSNWTNVFEQIVKLKNLNTLYCIGPTAPIAPDTFSDILQNCPLQSLHLNAILTADQLKELAASSAIHDIAFSIKATDYRSLELLSNLTSLRIVSVTAPDGLDEQLLFGLSKLTQVRFLKILGTSGDATEWLEQLHEELPDCVLMTENSTVLPRLRRSQ